MDFAEIFRAVAAAAATVTAALWLYRAVTGGLRPHPTPGGGWEFVGDATVGTRWATRAALLLAAGTAVAPRGTAQLLLLWATVGAAGVALSYHGAKQAQMVRQHGVTPAQVAAVWVAAGLATAGFVWWTMLMSGDDRHTDAGADTAAAAQEVLADQSSLMQNAVIAALLVLVVFLFLARRGYRNKSFRLRQTRARRPGQSSASARRSGRGSVRDPHSARATRSTGRDRDRLSRHR